MQIAFSGRLGSGKSTVCAILRDVYGYEIYSTGTIIRRVAEKMGISALEMNKKMSEDPSLDYKIDNTVTEISRERSSDKLVFDSRMAWHFAKNTFKVYMYVDPTVAAKRVFAADRGDVEKYSSVEDALEKLNARKVEENTRYQRIYNVNNLDYANYDLIVDSTSATPEQIAELIVNEAEKFALGAYSGTKLMLSPYVIFPTKPLYTDDGDEIAVTVKDGHHFAVVGHKPLIESQKSKTPFIEARLVNAVLYTVDLSNIAVYESYSDFIYETKPE